MAPKVMMALKTAMHDLRSSSELVPMQRSRSSDIKPRTAFASATLKLNLMTLSKNANSCDRFLSTPVTLDLALGPFLVRSVCFRAAGAGGGAAAGRGGSGGGAAEARPERAR